MVRHTVPLVLASVLVGAVVVSCSKADSSKPTGSSAPRNDPGSRGVVADGSRGVVGGPRGVVGGPKGAAEGAMPEAAAPGAPDDSFQVETTEAGSDNVARVVVRPGKGFHMNKDYPTKLTLELPAGVSSPKAVLEPADAESFTDNQLAFAVKLTAASKGEYTIPATLKFAVCTDATCDPKKHSIAWLLKAQ